MLRTKFLISEVTEVPREWVFEYYLNCERLTGQDVKMRSIFNPDDKTPSMFIYFKSDVGYYKFKDFSSGKSGDGITLVQHKFNLTTRGEAAHKIIEDYNKYILNAGKAYVPSEFKVQQKYKVTQFETREWTNLDQKYWTKYHIGSKLLEKYNVKPLLSYKMIKEEDGKTKELTIKGRHYIYGYFRNDGVLYKIYQPMVTDCKFIRIVDHIHGVDQLTLKVPYLVICSSLKDLMAFNRLGYTNAEAIAPNSENTLIPEHMMAAFKTKYKGIVTLFDNDTAGIKAMKKYEEKYEIPYAHLEMSKDLSDSIKDRGLFEVKEKLTPILRDIFHANRTTVSS